MAKRILHKFQLDEISGVDRMAQAGAKLVLMKRDTDFVKGAFMDAVAVMEAQETIRELWEELWESESAMYDAVWNIQNNPERYPNVEESIIEALGEYSEKVQEQAAEAAATDPSMDVEKSASDDPAIESDHSEGDGDNNPLNPEEDTMSKKPDEVTVEGLTKDLEGVNVKLAKAESFGKLTDMEKAHYASLDEAGQDEFLKMDEGARADVLDELAKGDPVVYTAIDGTEFHKSDDERMVRMAKRADDAEKREATEIAKRVQLEFAKRAEDELSHLPGSDDAKVSLLKAISEIDDESQRGEIDSLLKAADSAQSAAFESNGSGSPAVGSAEEQLDNMAKAYAKEKDVSFAKAYTEVLETDEGQALYTQSQS